MDIEKFTFNLNGHSYPNSSFYAGVYNNGNCALSVANEEGRVCVCSVNTGNTIPDTCIAVKNYSENEGMEESLREQGIIGKKVFEVRSGWVSVPVFELTEKGLALYK